MLQGALERHRFIVHTRTNQAATIVGQSGLRGGIVGVFKPRVLPFKGKKHIARGTFTVFGYDNLRHSVQVVALIVFKYMVVFGAMHKQNHVGILLSFKAFTVLYVTTKLRQRNDGDV